MQYLEDGQWYPGLDSGSYQLGQGFYQWGQNITNRGGIIATRQGFAQIKSMAGEDKPPRGIILFSAFVNGVNPFIVVAIGDKIYKLAYPYTGELVALTDENNNNNPLVFPMNGNSPRSVHFEVCVQAQMMDDNGIVKDIAPRFVLIIQDGVTKPGYWYFDGATSHSGHTNPSARRTNHPPWNTPIGAFTKWAGSRLWVGTRNRLFAGDLLNPLQFEEQRNTATGGFFFLPGTITGMGVTHDYKSMLVMTPQTTSAFQVGIEDRELWSQTQDFQRVILPSIGCTSDRTIINQYGMTWWESHDGIVALDSSLQTYQTSRMQVKDNNMSRSKEMVSWSQGGGCSGTFGDWLLFSQPSGSRNNVHTWVMDQSVQQNLNAITPPAWCSNWTGIRPEEWVTGTVNGVQRCFCISNDLVPSGHQATIWEAFIGQRMDIPMNGASRVPKDIACAFEQRFMGLAPSQFMKFRYAELDLAEIVGTVRLQVYYCGRRTSYKKILDKQITATVSDATETIFDPDDIINVFVPQFRTVRTVTDSHDEDDANSEVQTPYIRSIDREFSLLVTWVGQMAITGIRMCVDPMPDYQEGVAEEDELTKRVITAEGTGEILDDPVNPNNFVYAFQSKYLAPLRPRWVEFPAYDAATANGVFFVDIPEFSPLAGGYPIGSFQPFMAVAITTEAIADTIVYTTDGTVPRLAPLNGTIYTGPIHVNTTMLPFHLKAIGFRDGMSPSAVQDGTFSQARAATPLFSPVAGTYPAGDYPELVTIICSTPDARIRYTTNNTAVTQNSPLYSAPVSVAAGHFLRAKAFATGYIDSIEAIGRYVAQPQCAKPTFTPDGGAYSTYPQNIVMHSSTPGSQIRYTINDAGIDGGTLVSNPHTVSVNSGDELRARAEKASLADSEVKDSIYTSTPQACAEPSFSPDGFDGPSHQITVRFNLTTPNATIGYNIGDAANPPDDPTHDAHQFEAADGDEIMLQLGHKIIKAVGFRADLVDSPVHSRDFDFDQGG